MEKTAENKPWYREIIDPFINLTRTSRALKGVFVPYVLEGMCYFGILGYLAMHFSDYIFKDVENPDIWSHNMVMVLTAGITLSQLALGFVCDKWGVRRALLFGLSLLLTGRVLMSAAATSFGLEPAGPWSALHLWTMAGIVIIAIGYGMYQPAAYTAVKQFTTAKTATMGFAMLYALMNLGGWLPTFAFLARDDEPWEIAGLSIPCLGLGIPGMFWIYTGFTLLAMLVTFFILTRKTVAATIAANTKEEKEEKKEEEAEVVVEEKHRRVPKHFWLILIAFEGIILWRVPLPYNFYIAAGLIIAPALVYMFLPQKMKWGFKLWLANHPLADSKFAFFIFIVMFVQTLFTYNWLVLPQYLERTFTDSWIGEKFEIVANFNPILIFVLAPIIAVLSRKAKVYNMMVAGTFVMAAPAFLLAIGANPVTLFGYIFIMTIGEAMWQPRFMQYAAEIAPEGRTGQYMGVASFPWFLTKVLAPLLLTGWMMEKYCPSEGELSTRTMWLIFGCIAMVSPIGLLLAKPWVGKDFKTKSTS